MSKLPKGKPTRDGAPDPTLPNALGDEQLSEEDRVQLLQAQPTLLKSPIAQSTLGQPPAGDAASENYSPVAPTLPLSEAQAISRQIASPTPTAASTEATQNAGSRFRRLRPWREGGLGKVSIALDEELHREVALKEIKSHHATSKQSQDRFLLEAEITGSLEHPGVVPVYGMGRYSDGRPYYAMRFVHGDSLEEAIHQFHHAAQPNAAASGERTVAFRELLSRFIAVCNAIAYAHSRGVLHRDLKPGNILLAKYGETLVVDWGLAKVAGQNDQLAMMSGEAPLEVQSTGDSAPTRFGSVIGTPGYMSPEQAEGRLDLLGPASDIYSLGATLYCLLTGVSPFTASTLDSLLDKVKRGEFSAPRQINPGVARPLEAICLKAMSLKREARYATASDLANDLAHWLADEPVAAYPERPLERTARWVRRHRDAAVITAVGLTLLAVVSVVAAVLVNHQRMIAAQMAHENGRLAVQERAAKNQAEIAFREARDAVDDLFTRVSEDTLLNQPGMQGLRKDLLQKTLDYYQKFLQQRADDPSVKKEYAMTLFRAGRILDELQSPEKAIPYLEQARDLQQKLLSDSPNDRYRLQALGDTQNALGRSLHESQKFDEAIVAYQKARDLRQQLAQLYSQEQELQRLMANSIMNVGLVEKDRGQLEAAADHLHEAQQIRLTLLAKDEDFPKLERDLAMGSYNEGLLELNLHRPDEAVKRFGSAIERLQQLVARDPRDLTMQYLLAICYRRSADAQSDAESPAESERLYELARDQFARLVDRNPDVMEYRAELASIYLNMARVQQRPNPAAAQSDAEKSRAILAELVKQYPQNPQFRRNLAVSLRTLSILQFNAKQFDAAQANMRAAIDYLEQLIREFPDNKDYQTDLKKTRLQWDEEQSSGSAEIQAA